jgi:PelA/Pel-15E family pectate lyase
VDVQPLLSAEIDGESEMVAWAWESPTQARAFGFTGLHFHSNWQLPEYRRLVVQGVRWCLRQPIPATGVEVDIPTSWLELDGQLPMAASPAAIEWSKQLQAEQRVRQKSARRLLDQATELFNDGIRHYQNEHRQHDYARYSPDQIEAIAENICRHQRDGGGWPKNWDPLRRLSLEEIEQLEAARGKVDSTLDNRTGYPQVDFLAAAYQLTGESRFREAALRGIEYLLAAQGEHGGWPHAYPNRSGYSAMITFNDAVTVGVLDTLTRIAHLEPAYDFLPEPIRQRVVTAVAAGQACLLRLQLVVDGVPTGWAQQYDPQSLVPATARSYELPAIAAAESVGVVRYLMSLPEPNPEVIESVERAVAWFRRVAIHGKRIEQVPIEPVQFTYHTARWDRVEVEDPAAPPIWARFYDLESNRPFMANRDGTKVYRLADVELERRTGYGWFTGAPGSLLEKDYPAWKARLDQASAGR